MIMKVHEDNHIHFQIILKRADHCEGVGPEFDTLRKAVLGSGEVLTNYAKEHGKGAYDIIIGCYFRAPEHGAMWLADYSRKGEFLECTPSLLGPGPNDPDKPDVGDRQYASIPGSKNTRCFEITVEQVTKIIHCEQLTTDAHSIAAAECVRNKVREQHGKEGDIFNILDVEELFKPGDIMFYIKDEHEGFWVKLKSNAIPYDDNPDEEVINEYVVERYAEDEMDDVEEFMVTHDMLTNVPFRLGFNRAGLEADPENIYLFPDSGHASDHLDRWFEDVPIDSYSANDKKQLADLLDGKSNVAMIMENIYWIIPVNRPA
jgi:hypothetical protein